MRLKYKIKYNYNYKYYICRCGRKLIPTSNPSRCPYCGHTTILK